MSKVTIDYLRQQGRSWIGKDGFERIEVPLKQRLFVPGTREATIKAFLPTSVCLTVHAWDRFTVLVGASQEAVVTTAAPASISPSVIRDGFGAGVEIV